MDIRCLRYQVILVICQIYICLVMPTFASTTNSPTVASNTRNCLNPEDCLQKDLFLRYNKYVRPVIDPLSRVNVEVTLVVNSLMDIAEKDETMTIVGFLRCFWHDEFLTWNSTEYGGVDHLIIPAERIWLPDIAISNSASNFYDITHKRDFHVEIKSDGLVRWAFGGIFTSNCNINLEQYPFDIQRCSIEIENWMYVLKDVNLDLNNGSEVRITGLGPNAVWYFSEYEAVRTIKYESFVSLKFTLVWKRKTLYYYVNIVIPIVLMVLVTLGVFWLPADCGEKMSLAITIVLSFSVFQIIVMENTPVNSDVVPGMTSMVMLVSVLSTVTLLTSMLVVYISSKCPNTRAPAWMRNLCFNYLAKALFMTSSMPKQSEELDSKVQKDTKQYDNSQHNQNGHADSSKHFSLMDNLSHKSLKQTPVTGISTVSEATDLSPHKHHNQSNHNNHISSAFHSVEGMDNNKEQLHDSSSLKHIVLSLLQIRTILEEKESSQFISDEWKFIAKVVDRCMFWMTSIIFITSFVYLFFRS